jgi:hypothetical protein
MRFSVSGNTYENDGVIYLLPTLRFWKWNGHSTGIDITWIQMSLFVGVEK